MNTFNYRADIDGLRAFAVLSVVFYHLFPGILNGGLAGVDVFFVISGFLITGILIKNQAFSPSLLLVFYIRRIKRLFPALLAVLAAVFVFGWFALYPDDFKDLGFHIFSSAIFTSNFVYMGEAGYFDTASELKPLLHLWSLAVEEQFYIIWPVVLFWFAARKHVHFLIACLAAMSFALCVYLTIQESSAAYYMPLSRFWELLAGAWLAIYCHRSKLSAPTPRLITYTRFAPPLALAVLLLSLALINPEYGFPGWQALFPVTATVVLLHSGQNNPLVYKVLANPFAVFIGKISYPLYLWHWPIISYLNITETTVGPVLRLAAFLASMVLAALTYWLLEKPAQKGAGKTAAVLASLMALVGYIGYNAYSRDGLNFRPVNYQAYKQLYLQSIGQQVPAATGPVEEHIPLFLKEHPNYEQQLFAVATALKQTSKPADTFSSSIKGPLNPSDPSNCSAAGCDQAKPLIVLLGDSYAGNTYTALATTHPHVNFKIFAEPGCTPMRKRYRRENHRCLLLFNEAIRFIQHNKVQALVLAARWPVAVDGLEQDLVFYKKLVPHVGLVGPGMSYDKDITAVMLQAQDGPTLFKHTVELQEDDRFLANHYLKAMASQLQVSYFDRLEPFCTNHVCNLTFTGKELLVYDDGHLSMDGALVLGHSMLKKGWVENLLKSSNSQ